MRDDAVKALFAALDAEPRPEFVVTLRERLERDWPAVNEHRAAPSPHGFGDVIEIRDTVAERGSARRQDRRRAFVVGAVAVVSLILILSLMVRSRAVQSPADAPSTMAVPP